MEKTTTEKLKNSFEENYNHTYKTSSEFVNAVEEEYCIEEVDGEFVFSGGDMDFIVTDWNENW